MPITDIPKRTSPLTENDISSYQKNGFLLMKQGCSHDLIDAYNRHIRDIRSSDPMPEWALPRRQGEVQQDERFSMRLFNPHKHDSFSVQMMRLDNIRGALAQLMGDEAMCVQSMYFYKKPGSHGQAAHQDYHYIRDEPQTMIAAWIAMEERVDEENGCLWVIPGSHKLGLLPHGAVKNLAEHESWTDETEGVDVNGQVPVVMEKGDILFFHELLIHSSNKNRSVDRWRRSFVCHYIRQDAMVNGRKDLQVKYPLY